MNKYRAKPTIIDGIRFASKAEARRYETLKMELAHGLIKNLELQPKYPIVINGLKVCTYIADFKYEMLNGRKIVEDVKGMRTPIFNIKRKLMEAVHGIEIYITQ